MNLSSYLPLWKFSDTRKAIADIKLKESFHSYGAGTVRLHTNEGSICPYLIVYKDDVIEFKLGLLLDTEDVILSSISHRLLDDFREELIKYIGNDAYDYAYRHSLNLDTQDFHFDSIMFSKEYQLYEFLTLVNRHGYFSIN